MSTENNITFEDNKFKIKSRVVFGDPKVPSIIKIMVKKRLVKNENQAVIIIGILVVLLITASIFMIKRSVVVTPAILDSNLILNK